MSLSALLLAGSLFLAAPAEPTAELTAQVRELVQRFEAPQKATRDAAEKSLLALGPAALAALPKLDPQASAEARQRLTRVRQTLEQLSASRTIDGQTLTLKGKHSLADVLQALRAQTGNPVIDYREQFGQRPQNVSLDCQFDKTPFWEALDRVLDQAQLTVYNHAGEEGLAVVGRAPAMVARSKGAQYVGAFRVSGADIVARRDLRNTEGRSLQLTIEFAWEPRLRPIVFLQPLKKFVVEDDRGEKLEIPHEANELEFTVQPAIKSLDLPLRLTLPDRGAKRIARVSGEVTALVPGAPEDFRFTGLVKTPTAQQRRGAATVTVERVSRNNQLWQVFLRVAFDRSEGALESHRTWILNNEAWLENAKGEKLAYSGLETTRQTENEVGLAYLFGVEGDFNEHTFVYRTPTTIARLPIPFELRDIELP